MQIAIIDYKVGNINSILNMIKKLGHKARITSDKEELQNAEKLILPGVGSFDYGMDQLKQHDFIDVLNKKVLEEKTPILGICLGAQLFTKGSEEGVLPGLGWFDANTVKFKIDSSDAHLKVPHMGWNNVVVKKSSSLMKNFEVEPRFYFVHSYHFKCNNTEDELAMSKYGYNFASALQRENIYGVQFHPEKSHKFGMQLIRNFIDL